GLLHLEERNWDFAVGDLETAVALDRRQYQAQEALAQVYMRQNLPESAAKHLGLAISLRPDLPALYRARADLWVARKSSTVEQRASALADLEKAISLESQANPVLARDHTNRGKLLHRGQRENEALAACDEALRRVPGYADAHRLRLDVLLSLKRYSDVTRSCD